jgi:hypothetical protein
MLSVIEAGGQQCETFNIVIVFKILKIFKILGARDEISVTYFFNYYKNILINR